MKRKRMRLKQKREHEKRNGERTGREWVKYMSWKVKENESVRVEEKRTREGKEL